MGASKKASTKNSSNKYSRPKKDQTCANCPMDEKPPSKVEYYDGMPETLEKLGYKVSFEAVGYSDDWNCRGYKFHLKLLVTAMIGTAASLE